MTDDPQSIREGYTALGCYLLVWSFTVLPMFIFVADLSGGALEALKGLAIGVIEFQIGSWIMLLLSLPLFYVGYAFWKGVSKGQ